MNNDTIILRPAVPADFENIALLMERVSAAMPHADWFVAGGRDYIREHLEGNGFILVAEDAQVPELAGFFVVDYPGLSEDNLGRDLGFTEEQCLQSVHMDTAVVAPEWRGHGLQARMMQAAEEELKRLGYHYLLATVHPDNSYSLNNAIKLNYQIMLTKEKYGGKLRHIVKKEI